MQILACHGSMDEEVMEKMGKRDLKQLISRKKHKWKYTEIPQNNGIKVKYIANMGFGSTLDKSLIIK